MTKPYLIGIIIAAVVICIGIVMVFADINNVTHYYYKGNLALDYLGYEDFKMQVNNRGIGVRPGDVQALAPDPKMGHHQIYLVIFDLEATKDFPFGKPEVVTKESNCAISILQIVLIAAGGVALASLLCCRYCRGCCRRKE